MCIRDSPGTTLRNVDSITWTLDYQCPSYHGGTHDLEIKSWVPSHEGYLTTGDNLDSNGCKVDQRVATGDDPRNGLTDATGNPVLAVKDGVHSILSRLTSGIHPMRVELMAERISRMGNFLILFIVVLPIMLPRLV